MSTESSSDMGAVVPFHRGDPAVRFPDEAKVRCFELYATAAARPVNSRLDCSKLARDLGISLPPWQEGLTDCIRELSPRRDGP